MHVWVEVRRVLWLKHYSVCMLVEGRRTVVLQTWRAGRAAARYEALAARQAVVGAPYQRLKG